MTCQYDDTFYVFDRGSVSCAVCWDTLTGMNDAGSIDK